MKISRTIIISCAGMGNRLGLGTTKALLEVDGKSLIRRHLEMLDKEDDIRVVVGYQAEMVIKAVREYRNDVMFVFNQDYRNNGTGASVSLAAKYANEFILSLDGDLLIHPEDMKQVLSCEHEFVGGGEIETDDPWLLQTYKENGLESVSAFTRNIGSHEWNGVTQLKSHKIQSGEGHVFQLIEPYLPIPYMDIRTREIDTVNDYERAEAWVKNGFR